MIPINTVERFCSYRQILFRWQRKGKERFYSHELAEEAGITAAQVRRDLMSLETIGTPTKGYITANIIEELGLIIEGESGQKIVLVGVGNLGRAITSYFVDRRPDLRIIACFDADPAKIGSSFASCPCLPLSELDRTIKANEVMMAILTVPEAVAQETAALLVKCGISAIINFTPMKIKVPGDVYVEQMDISVSLEKSAYFARMYASRKGSAESVGDAHEPGLEAVRQQSGGRILCIDDDRDVVESYRAVLQKAGYTVDAAFDGESGFLQAKESRPDLIILDVMMADPNEGFHVAYKLRQDDSLRNVPILMLTSVASESGFRFSKETDEAFLPVDAFVEKPVAPNSLLANVRKLLNLPHDQINVEGITRK